MNSDFDANDLRIIYYIANGFRPASISKMLGISAARISQKLKRMEKLCGAQLIYRAGKATKLTDAGNKLFELAANVERNVSKFKSDIASLKSSDGQLRIIATSSLLLDDLPDVLDDVIKKFPNIRIRLSDGTEEQVLKSVVDGTADVGLTSMPRTGEGVVVSAYKRERLCLLVSLTHPLAGSAPIYFKEASEYRFITLSSANIMATMLRLAQIRAGIVLYRSIKVTNLEIAAQFAVKGSFGITLTFENIAKRYVRDGGGCVVGLRDAWASLEVGTCTKDLTVRTAAQTHFLRRLKAKFSD